MLAVTMQLDVYRENDAIFITIIRNEDSNYRMIGSKEIFGIFA